MPNCREPTPCAGQRCREPCKFGNMSPADRSGDRTPERSKPLASAGSLHCRLASLRPFVVVDSKGADERWFINPEANVYRSDNRKASEMTGRAAKAGLGNQGFTI